MPFLKFEIDMPTESHRLADGLRNLVTRPNWLGLPQDKTALFIGRVHEMSFRIMRIVKGRDSFNPLLYGRFTQGMAGTHLDVILTFHPFVWFFIIAWNCFGLYAAFVGLGQAGPNRAIPLFMIFILWAIAVPIFYYDARKSKELLQECVKRIVEEASR